MASTTSSSKLEDQAASAALHADSSRSKAKSAHPVLDEDGKLSSAGAATSLKYARAQDLPSFPSAGLKMSSAGAAASLADSNKSTFEHWKPGSIPAANKAAMLAKDYEMDPLWQPEMSAAGSKAALLAHRDTTGPEIWSSPGTKEGHSAAGQAMAAKSTSKYAGKEREVPADVHQRALLAATGAMAGNRPRAGSTPSKQSTPKQDEDRSWAMKAATKSHHDGPASGPFASGDPGFEAARIQNMAKNNVNRQLYGSAPPVDIEVQEKNRQDTLRASAIAMAQKMYAIQQSHIEQASSGRPSDSHAAANSSHRRNLSDGSSIASDDAAPTAHRYENLEEAARKLAQERLAKLRDEHAEYRQYYGANNPQQRSRLSTRLRRRASTGSEDDSDEEQSRKIRSQMSMFQNKLAEVDKNKRQADRDALLVAAQKNVEARMAKMDKQVFEETGKASPAQVQLWEKEARERAQARIDVASQNVGKVHIGGGKYLDQEEVDAIARARLQPTLDDISDRAEKQRARDEEIRLEQERVKAQNEKEKAREAEVKAEIKAAQGREKQEMKAKKDEEKRAQKEQARLEKEENRKSKDPKTGRFSGLLRRSSVGAESAPVVRDAVPVTQNEPVAIASTTADTATTPLAHTSTTDTTVHDRVTMPTELSEQRTSVERVQRYEDTPDVAPALATIPVSATTVDESLASPGKRDSKVKSWFKKSLRGNPTKPQKDEPASMTEGATSEPRENSIRDVAMAGRTNETDDMYGSSAAAAPVSPVRETRATNGTVEGSSISSLSSNDAPAVSKARSSTENPHSGSGEAPRGIKQKLFSKMRSNRETESSHEATDPINTTDDEFEEARDTFEEKLSPPNTQTTPDRPRSSHGESKFTEEL